MKKLFVVLLVLAMLLSTTAMAKTATFDGFTIDIPDDFEQHFKDESSAYYSNMGIDIHVYQHDYDYSTLKDAVDGLGYEITMGENYKYDISTINGTEIALLRGTDWNESMGAVFAAGKHYYTVIYGVAGSLWGDEAEVWNAMAQSIQVTVTPEEAFGASDESTGDETYDYPTLEKGSKGDEVKTLQQRLVDLYWLQGSVDGDYGNKTKDAVERFQKAADLMVTGIADGKTQAKLFADDAPEAEMSVSCATTVMGNYGQTAWNVNGQSFTLKGNQTKTMKTPWGTYKFDAFGEYKKID